MLFDRYKKAVLECGNECLKKKINGVGNFVTKDNMVSEMTTYVHLLSKNVPSIPMSEKAQRLGAPDLVCFRNNLAIEIKSTFGNSFRENIDISLASKISRCQQNNLLEKYKIIVCSYNKNGVAYNPRKDLNVEAFNLNLQDTINKVLAMDSKEKLILENRHQEIINNRVKIYENILNTSIDGEARKQLEIELISFDKNYPHPFYPSVSEDVLSIYSWWTFALLSFSLIILLGFVWYILNKWISKFYLIGWKKNNVITDKKNLYYCLSKIQFSTKKGEVVIDILNKIKEDDNIFRSCIYKGVLNNIKFVEKYTIEQHEKLKEKYESHIEIKDEFEIVINATNPEKKDIILNKVKSKPSIGSWIKSRGVIKVLSCIIKRNHSSLTCENIEIFDKNLVKYGVEKKDTILFRTFNEIEDKDIEKKSNEIHSYFENEIKKADYLINDSQSKHLATTLFKALIINSNESKKIGAYISLASSVVAMFSEDLSFLNLRHDQKYVEKILEFMFISENKYFYLKKSKNLGEIWETWKICSKIENSIIHLLKEVNMIKENMEYLKKNMDVEYIEKNIYIKACKENNYQQRNYIWFHRNKPINLISVGGSKLVENINLLSKIEHYFDCKTVMEIIDEEDKYEKFIENVYGKNMDYNDECIKIYGEHEKIALKKKIVETYDSDNNKIDEIKKHIVRIIGYLSYYSNKKCEKLYNSIKLDHRLRWYYLGEFNHMNSKILRKITLFSDEIWKNENDNWVMFYISWQIKKSKNLEEGIKIYEAYWKNFKKEKCRNIYSLLCIEKLIKFERKFLISLDACASMLQIISILTRDEKLMKLCNIHNENNIYDVYDYIINKIDKKKIENKKYWFIMEERKIVKYVIMTYLYGAGYNNIFKNMREKKGMLTILSDKDKTVNKCIKTILDTFKKEFPKTEELKKFVKKYGKKISVEKNKNVEFNLWENFVSYKINKKHRIKYEFKHDKNKKISITTIEKDISKIDIEKTIISLFANYIHFIDSQILLKTRESLLKKNIKNLGIHDCILVENDKYRECVKEYNKTLEELSCVSYLSILNINKYEEPKKRLNIENSLYTLLPN